MLNYRITPAYAGKTKGHGSGEAVAWDHPRVCGKNQNRGAAAGLGAGSPPRMREKRGTIERHRLKDGITPAYAGKTLLRILSGILSRDHPRVCGKNILWHSK